MRLCPQCRQTLVEQPVEHCPGCGWEKTVVDGVEIYISAREREDRTLVEYVANYEALARKNLIESNIDRSYIRYQAQNIVRLVKPNPAARICDLGVGQGFLTRELLKANARDVTAVDISLSYLRVIGQERLARAVQANAERLPFVEEFDVIFCTDVMEHVLNLASFLICVNQALRPNGIFCVRVPYRENLLQYSPYVGCAYDFVHLRSFNEDLMRIYLRDSGFEVGTIAYDGFSLQTPQPWLMRSRTAARYYARFQDAVGRRLGGDVHRVTTWNSRLARLVMKPNEMVAIGRKVSRAVPRHNGIVELAPCT